MGSSEEEKLMQMVRDFIEYDSTIPISHTPSNPTQLSHNPTYLSLQEILERVSDSEAEVLDKILSYLSDMKAMDESKNLKKWIVSRLKMDNYEACLCKTSWLSTFGPPFTWVSTFGPPSGDYEYIDVMMKDEGKAIRLIIDMDFRSQFEVVRPTPTYTHLTNALPSIFVGNEDKLNTIISLLCSAAKQSLKEKGLHVPPWRRAGYMHSKWLSHNCTKVSLL